MCANYMMSEELKKTIEDMSERLGKTMADLYEDALNDRVEKIECSVEDFKRLGYTDEEVEELYKHINIYI